MTRGAALCLLAAGIALVAAARGPCMPIGRPCDSTSDCCFASHCERGTCEANQETPTP